MEPAESFALGPALANTPDRCSALDSMPDESEDASRSDFDEAWKELIETQLPQILTCFFPTVAGAIDWGRGFEFLNQELRDVIHDTNVQSFRVDLLVKAFRKDSGEQWLLLHLEIQSFKEADFEERIYHYNHGIHRAFGRQPVSLVILADLNAHWRPCQYVHEELSCETRFRFLACKLLDELDRLEDDFSLPAVAAKAQIAALRTVGNPEKRYEIRWRMTRALYHHGFSSGEVRAAYRVLSWMMRLPREMQLTFRRQVIEYEQGEKMPYLSDIEELAIEEGIERGMERGKLRATTGLAWSQLERRFGGLPATLRAEVEALPLAKAEALGLALLDFRSPEDLTAWLRNQANV